jgi:hypothetical protein
VGYVGDFASYEVYIFMNKKHWLKTISTYKFTTFYILNIKTLKLWSFTKRITIKWVRRK